MKLPYTTDRDTLISYIFEFFYSHYLVSLYVSTFIYNPITPLGDFLDFDVFFLQSGFFLHDFIKN